MKLRKGQLYHFTYKLLYKQLKPEESLGEFVYKESPINPEHTTHYFKELASTEPPAHPIQGFAKIDNVKRVPKKDLPLYLHLPYKSDLFTQYMKGESK